MVGQEGGYVCTVIFVVNLTLVEVRVVLWLSEGCDNIEPKYND